MAVFQPKRNQPQFVGSECVRGQNICTGLGVGGMDVAHQVWTDEVDFIVRAIDEDASVVKLGTHCTVKKNDAFVQGIAEVLHGG